MDFATKLTSHAEIVSRKLSELLAVRIADDGVPDRLGQAVRYAALSKGKRFRPCLIIESAALFRVPLEDALMTAAAIECIHCYSLVHDDLPAMDDDALRRGEPTVHIAFDEATAILAGDTLLTLAFEILSSPAAHEDPAIRMDLVQGLARSAGWAGMTGGQMLDIQSSELAQDASKIETMQAMKTGALIQFSCEAGAIIGGAPPDQRQALKTFGAILGRAFQVSDDLLDAEGSAETVGKATGKDDRKGKATLVARLGADETRNRLAALEGQAKDALSCLGDRAETLIDAARFVIHRRH